MSTAREEILGRIRQALSTPSAPMDQPDWETEIYHRPLQHDPMAEFAENFASRKAYIEVLDTVAELLPRLEAFVAARSFQHIKVWEPEVASLLNDASFKVETTEADLHEVEASITTCECLVARTGSFITSSRQLTGRRLTIYPPTHIVIAYEHQLVDDIKDGLTLMQQRYGDKWPSMVGLVTGASRTADIEKTLVLGAHGPKELAMFLIKQHA